MKSEERIEKLNRIGIALSSVRELDKLLEMIVLEARNLTGADAGSLYLKEGDYLYFKVSQNHTLEKKLGSRDNFFKPFNLKISKENIAGYVTITSKPLNIENAYLIKESDPYKHSKEFDAKFDYKTKSILTVPMVDHKNDVIGVLQLINALDKDFSIIPFADEYEDLLMSLASQAAVAINNARFILEIKDLFKAVVQYSASAIDARSPHTAGHSERVSSLAIEFAKAVNEASTGRFRDFKFSEDEIEEIRYAGWLHDIGKIGVKEIVLDKPTKVSDDNIRYIEFKFATLILEKNLAILEDGAHDHSQDTWTAERTRLIENLNFIKRINVPTERMSDNDVEKLKSITNLKVINPIANTEQPLIEEMEYENLSILRGSLNRFERAEAQSHVVKSIKILEKIPFRGFLKNIPDIVAHHHEYLDGSGYPKGVKGDQISDQSRMLCIVDIFDALVAKDRPYKPAMPLETALKILRKDAEAGKLDSELVELFIEKKVYFKGLASPPPAA